MKLTKPTIVCIGESGIEKIKIITRPFLFFFTVKHEEIVSRVSNSSDIYIHTDREIRNVIINGKIK